jgi:fructose-1,6-bisphosphatase I
MNEIDAILDGVVHCASDISSGLRGRRDYGQELNASGEKQLKADVWANEQLKEQLTEIDAVGQFASEEEDDVIPCGEGLSVTIDPLDGSSNLPTNNIVGTIVGVYDSPLPAPGKALVSSFYVVYGPIISLMVARDQQVDEYALEEDLDKKQVNTYPTNKDLDIPSPSIYGFGGSDDRHSESFSEFASTVRSDLKQRYGGSLVGDANQVLHRGGIYAYPGLKEKPQGKLRLQYEANPMAFIFKHAGGASSNGHQSILDVSPSSLHERTPLYIGNQNLIDRVESIVNAPS